MPSDFVDLTLQLGLELAEPDELSDLAIQRQLARRISELASEHGVFRAWCDRADALYYTTTFTQGGADLWADDPSATTPGRSHVSVNTPAVYVDVPAALTATKPIENITANEDSDEARAAAAALERIRTAWKASEKWDLKRHKAATVKGLYGRTAAFVYYDQELKRPCVDVVQNPRNLYIGYQSDDYEKVEWAAHVTLRDPNALVEQYSVSLTVKETPGGRLVPWIGEAIVDRPRPELNFGPARIEVWDYWYRLPAKTGKYGSRTKMETWNVVVAGNAVVHGPFKYSEYRGRIPYLPVYNTFVPSVPTGRADLHDMEQIIREKMTRITAGAQMIAGATAGDFWQLVGPEAPSRTTIKPVRNLVVAPGAGNRIEAITPFIAQFQLEQFLGRLDREAAAVSGLNDLLLGLAPLQSLSSSKAINALVANFETRISMRRLLFYSWDVDVWDLVIDVFAAKNKDVRSVVMAGGGTLNIINPSLSPRDEAETAIRAANLVGAKLWSQARGMDAVGVDDPEQEQNIIRSERTDATMFPADVGMMAQLMGVLKSLGIQEPASVQGQAQGQLTSGQNDLRTALGAGVPQGDTGSQGVEMQGQIPPEGLSPGATPPTEAPFIQGPAPAPQTVQLQNLIQGGQAKGRIITNQQLGRR